MSNKNTRHTVFVLAVNGQPLTPTTPCRARKMMRVGVAKPTWSKFGTFGIQMLVETRQEAPQATVGIDNGTKFEGYTVVCGRENNLAIKLDLPDKNKITHKLDERQILRRDRRRRHCRQRRARFNNRGRDGFLTPSQTVIVTSRLKILRELFHIYPIDTVAFEDVRFNPQHYWGMDFSAVEVGKQRLRRFFAKQGANLFEFRGWQTKKLREKYGYKKASDKSADVFEAHCTDALALACEVGPRVRVEPSPLIVVDDTYRPVRRKLHHTQPAQGGTRDKYSRGTVFGLRKGLFVGTPRGRTGRLCGENNGAYRYYDEEGKRRQSKRLDWISSQFITRGGANPPQ